MSTPQYPSVELIQRPPEPDPGTPRRGRRWVVFLSVLVLASAVGLAVVYARPAVYRASVSVLTVKPKPVDMPSADADLQHVAIQERLLLGEELLGRLARRLRETGDVALADRDALLGVLSVVPVPETNLLELRAQGDDPQLLQRVVNEWADSYEGFRLEEIKAATGRTTEELKDEQGQIQGKLEAARAELAAFREAHDIVSLQRDENRNVSALKGINNSLNKARERLIEARARLSAIDEAIARGETVVPSEQKREIAKLRAVIARNGAKLAELRTRYTDLYLSQDPKYRDLPALLEEQRRELEAELETGRNTVRDEALQAVQAASASVAALQSQLAEDQTRVQRFTDRFNEFKVLEEKLAILERLYAEREQRLAQIDVQNQQKFPPIQVMERAPLPGSPISPDYQRDAAIALGSALALALFVTWLLEYLGGRPGGGAGAPILGVRISHVGADGSLPAPGADPRLGQQGATEKWLSFLEAPEDSPPAPEAEAEAFVPRELAARELQALLSRLDPPVRALAALLLSGVAPHELALLGGECFDAASRRVSVPGSNRRDLVLDAASWRWVEPLLEQAPAGPSALLSGLDIRLASAARQAGIADPGAVTALALWHTYAAYLARQGVDMAALADRVGPIPEEVSRALTGLAPGSGADEPPAPHFTHPALAPGA